MIGYYFKDTLKVKSVISGIKCVTRGGAILSGFPYPFDFFFFLLITYYRALVIFYSQKEFDEE